MPCRSVWTGLDTAAKGIDCASGVALLECQCARCDPSLPTPAAIVDSRAPRGRATDGQSSHSAPGPDVLVAERTYFAGCFVSPSL